MDLTGAMCESVSGVVLLLGEAKVSEESLFKVVLRGFGVL